MDQDLLQFSGVGHPLPVRGEALMSHYAQVDRVEIDTDSESDLKATITISHHSHFYFNNTSPSVTDVPEDIRKALLSWLTKGEEPS